MQPSLGKRLVRGVVSHFRLRVAEWATAALLFQFGWILYFPPSAFATSPNFAVMAKIATEETWGYVCLAIGGVHLLALFVNGTFPGFRYSPHVRALCSLLSCGVWWQILVAVIDSGVGGTAIGTYRIILALEFWNLTRASLDTGVVEGRRRRDDPA